MSKVHLFMFWKVFGPMWVGVHLIIGKCCWSDMWAEVHLFIGEELLVSHVGMGAFVYCCIRLFLKVGGPTCELTTNSNLYK